MVGLYIVAIVLFVIAGIGYWRAPTWQYHGGLIAWGLAFLAAAIGWAALRAAF